MKINRDIELTDLGSGLSAFWKLAGEKAELMHKEYDETPGSPVFTVKGKYTARGWTEWTQGFQYGIPLLVFLSTGDEKMLERGRTSTFRNMAHHLSHSGVHDHGFNNLSTYGNLLRAANRGLFSASREEKEFYALALKISGAVQAGRWTVTGDGGFIYSFNGPHSLFIDTIRTCRILLVSHLLGHRMLGEGDRETDMLERALVHGMTTARYAVYYGKGRDSYDVRGRCAHESIFNTSDGSYRCPNSQQGYSGYSTWTRGLGWAILGFSEFLEFLADLRPGHPMADQARESFLRAARATTDFYIENSASDGIPYWDTGAPGLHRLGRYQDRPAEPYNEFEPVDSSAAAIAAQGMLRLGRLLEKKDAGAASGYFQAGLTILDTLLTETYLCRDSDHQGILLHTLYHHPNGWDHIPEGFKIPAGESAMWGDYHMAELCFLADQILRGGDYRFYTEMEIGPQS